MDGQKVVHKALYEIIEREIGIEHAEKVTDMLLELDQSELSKLCSDADLMIGKIKEYQNVVMMKKL